jgi:hypothetical protein
VGTIKLLERVPIPVALLHGADYARIDLTGGFYRNLDFYLPILTGQRQLAL